MIPAALAARVDALTVRRHAPNRAELVPTNRALLTRLVQFKQIISGQYLESPEHAPPAGQQRIAADRAHGARFRFCTTFCLSSKPSLIRVCCSPPPASWVRFSADIPSAFCATDRISQRPSVYSLWADGSTCTPSRCAGCTQGTPRRAKEKAREWLRTLQSLKPAHA